jgi:membrane protein
MSIRDLFAVLKETWEEFNADKVPRLGAALAYFTIFSLAPLLIVVIGIAGFFLGGDNAQAELLALANEYLGAQGAAVVADLIANATQPGSGLIATTIGVGTLLFGASNLFAQLQGTLNTIWGVEPRPDRGVLGMVRDRSLAFAFVLGSGFLLLAVMVAGAVLNVLNRQVGEVVPNQLMFDEVLNRSGSLVLTTLLFAVIYKVVPDARVAWRDVLLGAFVTAVLFSIGRFFLGWYLSTSGTSSVYGAAGSLVVLLFWIFISAQIFFLGAEFTQVVARKRGAPIRPARNAVAVGKWNPAKMAREAVDPPSSLHG